MKNKIIMTIVVVLAAGLLFQTAYSMGRRSAQPAHSQPAPVNTRPEQPVQHEPQPPVRVHRWVVDPFFDDMGAWDPFAEMDRIQQRMHRLFDDGFSRGIPSASVFRRSNWFEPNISIHEEGSQYIVRADVPGMDKDAIDIEINGRQLTISGERKAHSKQEDQGYYRQELSYGSFSRSIMLPDDARTDEITSRYEHGVLTITIPRSENKKPAQPPIKVPVT
jgi:HSP20 family protein